VAPPVRWKRATSICHKPGGNGKPTRFEANADGILDAIAPELERRKDDSKKNTGRQEWRN
jgi:hypothetical protein